MPCILLSSGKTKCFKTGEYRPGGKTLQVKGSSFNIPKSQQQILEEQARMQGDMPIAKPIINQQARIREEEAAKKKLANQPTVRLSEAQKKDISAQGLKEDLLAEQMMRNKQSLSNPDEGSYMDVLGNSVLKQIGFNPDVLSSAGQDIQDNGLLGLGNTMLSYPTGAISGRYETPSQAIGRFALRNDANQLRNAMIDDQGNPTGLGMTTDIFGPMALGHVLPKGANLSNKVLKSSNVSNIGNKKYSLNYNQILGLSDDEVKLKTGMDKDYWESVIEHKPDRYGKRLEELYNQNYTPSQEQLNILESGKKDLIDFYSSPEYNKRIMEGMGINHNEALAYQNNLINAINKTEPRFIKSTGTIGNSGQLQSDAVTYTKGHNSEGSILGIDYSKRGIERPDLKHLNIHELGHASIHDDKNRKILESLPELPIEKETLNNWKNWNEEGEGNGVYNDMINYFSDPDEARQRAISSLIYAKNKGLSIDDIVDMPYMEVVRKNQMGEIPEDLMDLRKIYDQSKLKNYLKKIYTYLPPALLLGTATQEKRDGGGKNKPNIKETPTQVDAFNDAKTFQEQWMKSPMYNQMLTNSVEKDDPTGVNSSYVDYITMKRQQGVNASVPEATDWSGDHRNIVPGKSDYFYNNQLRGANLQHRDAGGTDEWFESPLGYSFNDARTAYNNEGYGFIPNKGYFETLIKHNLPHHQFRDTSGHEVSHASDWNGWFIPEADKIKMAKYYTPYAKDIKHGQYVGTPTETRARLNSIRQLSKDAGYYDPFTQKATMDVLNKFKTLDNAQYQQLREIYTDPEILDMLNTISMSDNNQYQNYG